MYRKKADACRNLLDFALYITFFPQLIAGPILRIGKFLPQLRRKNPVTPEEILRISLEIELDAELAGQEPLARFGPSLTDADFPAIVEGIRQQIHAEFGPRGDLRD